jgi:voltage-gated potassium channel
MTEKWKISHLGFIGIFITIIFILLVMPIAIPGLWTHFMMQGCFTLLILFIIYTIRDYPVAWYIGLGSAVAFIILMVLSFFRDSLIDLLIADCFFIILLIAAMVALGRMLWKKSEVDTNLIFAAITIYLLAGVLWEKIYLLINASYENSFHGLSGLHFESDHLTRLYEVQSNLLYYSFTTLATLGMGDITPLVLIAKSVTMLEATFGQLYVAIFIAKMVGVWRSSA